jgi:hypothetical protein
VPLEVGIINNTKFEDNNMKRTLIAVCVILLFFSPLFANYKESLHKGDYAGALKEIRPLAQKGDSNAQSNLGMMYATGRGVPQNSIEAEKWIRKAAEQGLAEAQYNLGLINVKGLGVPQNNAEALKWFRKSSDQGYAKAQYSLGVMYLQGLGVPKNLEQAYMWWYLSGSKGNQDAVKAINAIKGKMSPAQIAHAKKLASQWKPKK